MNSLAHDYISKTHADTAFSSAFADPDLPLTSYYTSLRHGLQGLGFISASWDGSEHHCGYDRDCLQNSGQAPKTLKFSYQAAVESAKGCTASEYCNPTTLKVPANGVAQGVSSFRALPSGNFFDISEVVGSDAIWDYASLSKVGSSSWPGLNRAFFFLFDVVLSKGPSESSVMGVPAHQWTLSSLRVRNENCDGGSNPDSPGIDCLTPPGMINVGHARDPVFPSPLFVSQPDLLVSVDGAGKSILQPAIQLCDQMGSGVEIPRECRRPLPNSFDRQTYHITGKTICSREAWQLNLQLKQTAMFQNSPALLPLFWQAEHFCTSTLDWFEMNQIEFVGFSFYDFTLSFIGWLHLPIWGIFCCYKTFKSHDIDISTPYSDKPCV